MKSFYKSDWFLKIISLIIAIVLWVYIAYEQKPQYETWIRDIEVVRTNLSQDYENGKLVIMDGTTDKIDIKISGDRKDVSAIKQSDITATIDMLGVNSEGVYSLPISISIPMDGIDIVQKSPSHATMKVDKIITVEKRITAETKGTIPEGYVVGDFKTEPASVKLTGPESIINTISSAKTTIDLAEASQNPDSLFKIKLYDSNETEIINPLITHNIEYVKVTDLFTKTKMADVIVNLGGGTNKNGDEVEYTVLSSVKVQLMGEKSALDAVSTVSTEEIDAYDVTSDLEINVKLIVPDGVKLVNSADENVKVKLSVK